MNYARLILPLLFYMGGLTAADVPCNERARQGRIGAYKAFTALVGCAGLHHMVSDVWSSSEPLRSGQDVLQWRRRSTAVRETLCSTIALIALGYVVYTCVSESVESLNIFFDDDEELDVSSKEKGTL